MKEDAEVKNAEVRKREYEERIVEKKRKKEEKKEDKKRKQQEDEDLMDHLVEENKRVRERVFLRITGSRYE